MRVSYETYKLKNGMQVLLIPSNTTYSTTISTFIKSGSALENPLNQGITHFVEHISLSATEKWPTKKIFNEAIEFNGADHNGWTSKETLNYNINIPYNRLGFGVDFISQVLYSSRFNKADVEHERTIILDELSKYEDDVHYQNTLFTSKLLSVNKSAYILEIGGVKEIVEKLSLNDLKNHYKTVHDPSRIMLTLVGNFNPVNAKKIIDKTFGHIPSKHNLQQYPNDDIKTSITIAKTDNKTDLALTTIVLKGPAGRDLTTTDTLILDIMLKILSGPMSSRLKKRLRDEEGLLYNIGAEPVIYMNLGAIIVHYSVSPHLFEKTFKIVFEELNKFANSGVEKKELDHFTEFISNRNLVHYDNIHTYSGLIQYPLYKDREIFTLEQMNKIIKSFTPKDINEAIRKYFKLDGIDCIAYGNVNKKIQDIMGKTITKYK